MCPLEAVETSHSGAVRPLRQFIDPIWHEYCFRSTVRGRHSVPNGKRQSTGNPTRKHGFAMRNRYRMPHRAGRKKKTTRCKQATDPASAGSSLSCAGLARLAPSGQPEPHCGTQGRCKISASAAMALGGRARVPAGLAVHLLRCGSGASGERVSSTLPNTAAASMAEANA